MNIIPLYLYSNDKVSFVKEEPFENSFQFFVFNPKVKPYGGYTNLFCIKESEDGTVSDVTTLYDPYNKSVPCKIKFLAWLDDMSCTIPLYLYKVGDKIVLNKIPQEGLIPHKIKTIHVLPNASVNLSNCKGVFQSVPDFTFDNKRGKIVPDPHSNMGITQAVQQKYVTSENLHSYDVYRLKEKINSDHTALYIFLILLLVLVILLL
jgi:hypothetical protein